MKNNKIMIFAVIALAVIAIFWDKIKSFISPNNANLTGGGGGAIPYNSAPSANDGQKVGSSLSGGVGSSGIGLNWQLTLQNGTKGPEVKQLQSWLNVMGYNAGTVDGIFGTKTQAALKLATKNQYTTTNLTVFYTNYYLPFSKGATGGAAATGAGMAGSTAGNLVAKMLSGGGSGGGSYSGSW